MNVRQVMVRRVGWPFGRTLDLELERTAWMIGRDGGCWMDLADPAVSRRHAALERSGGRLVVRDLGSANGVWHDGSRTDERALEPGDRLLVGRTELCFRGAVQVWAARTWPAVAVVAVAIVVILLREAVAAPPRAGAALVDLAVAAALEPDATRAKDLAELVGLHPGSASLAVPLARLIDAGDPLDPAVSLDDWLGRARTLARCPALDEGARGAVERRAAWLEREGRQVRELRSAERELAAGAHATAFARFERARALVPDAPAVPWYAARFEAERARAAAAALARATTLVEAGRHDEAEAVLGGAATDAGVQALRERIAEARAHGALEARALAHAAAGDELAACAAWRELAATAEGEAQARARAALTLVEERADWAAAEEAYARGEVATAGRLLERSWSVARAAPARALAVKVAAVARVLARTAADGIAEDVLAASAVELAGLEPDARHPARVDLARRLASVTSERGARAAALVVQGGRELEAGRLEPARAAWTAACAAEPGERRSIEGFLAPRAEALFNPAWRRRHSGERTAADAALWPLLADFLPAGHSCRERAVAYAKR